MDYQNTRQAAKRLGISVSRLARAIWDERFQAPTKGPGGAFIWTDDDLRRASWALLGHDLDEVAAGKGEDHV